MITIEVTIDDIAAGTRENSELCPIARAMCRALGGKPVFVYVDYAQIYPDVYMEANPLEVQLPRVARNFVIAFDAYGFDGYTKREVFKPFSFDLEVPEPNVVLKPVHAGPWPTTCSNQLLFNVEGAE